MKIRIKFSKVGHLKYIGHLDIMGCFQKVMRRSEVDIAYSAGFSPHQIMSFASPLGLGLTSDGGGFCKMKQKQLSVEIEKDYKTGLFGLYANVDAMFTKNFIIFPHGKMNMS